MTTLANDKRSLRIFEAFEVDYELPKWKHRMSEGANFMMYNNITRNRDGGINVNAGSFISIIEPFQSVAVGASGYNGDSSGNNPGLMERIFGKNKRKQALQKRMEEDAMKPNMQILPIPEDQEHPEMSVEDFFNSVKNSVEELELVKDKLEGYTAALEKLKNLGQTALYQSMAFDVEMYRAEAQMFATDMTKYVSEDNIVHFIKKSPKALRLDWIKNFVRIIPDDVAAKKIKADELHIFDNYVVLHYDPDGRGSEMTVEEKVRAKDPILFGVVIGSRKLYYIGDWIDEYCDLTLEKVIEFMGEGVVKNITKDPE